MSSVVQGVVLRVEDYAEHDKRVTLLTAEEGKIHFVAKGARSVKSKITQLAAPFQYAELELYEKNGFYWLRGGEVLRSFYSVTEDLSSLSLADYLCDVACDVSGEGAEAQDLTCLLLNSLYALSEKKQERDLIKSVYELRVASLSGYAPYDLETCAGCSCPFGQTDAEGIGYFDLRDGRVFCPKCFAKGNEREKYTVNRDDVRTASPILPVNVSILHAMRYILSSPSEKIFSFRLLEKADREGLAKITEAYLTEHLERSFDTLAFYKQIISL